MIKRHMLHKFVLLTIIAVVATIVASVVIFPAISRVSGLSSAQSAPQDTGVPNANHGYIKRIFTNAQGKSLVYYLYIPSHYNPHQSYPLVLLLHGDGEKSNPKKTSAQNQRALLRNSYVGVWTSAYTAPDNPGIQQHWPSFVVVPQISTSQQWINVPVRKGFYKKTKQPSTELLMTMQLLNVLQHEYAGIDGSRRYITGISSGAFGTWDAIERWPNYFAAAAPIAGAGDPSKAAVLKNLPIWAFHGTRDRSVAVSGSRNMIAAIKAAGGKPRYTEFPKFGHGIWGNVYSLAGAPAPVARFFPWLFSQKR